MGSNLQLNLSVPTFRSSGGLRSTPKSDQASTALDRTKWDPLCTIVVTHRNYSRFLEDSILSLIDQTYSKWECIVVDDCSSDDERRAVRQIFERLSDKRCHLIENAERLGQIDSFFLALAGTKGEFVSPLDPDDRLDPAFLEELLEAHLNEAVFCPVAFCEQKLFRTDGGLLTGTWKGRMRNANPIESGSIEVTRPNGSRLLFFPSTERDWLWSSSSAMMIRRSALDLIAPNKPLGCNGLDGYLARGAHFLGGTLFLQKALVYRGVHDGNHYLANKIFSMEQNFARHGWRSGAGHFKQDIVEAMFANGVERWFDHSYIAILLRTQFDNAEMRRIKSICPEAYKIWRSTPRSTRKILAQWYKRFLRWHARLLK
jgi:glycosyltransferase involved in cell wall biosynthesis